MSDAQEAILDIAEALEEYGSNIVIRTITKGDLSTYDPRNPTSNETITDVDSKGLIYSTATKDLAMTMPKELLNNYEISIVLQSDTPITKANIIIFQSVEREIVFVSKKILQDLVLSYEVLVK